VAGRPARVPDGAFEGAACLRDDELEACAAAILEPEVVDDVLRDEVESDWTVSAVDERGATEDRYQTAAEITHLSSKLTADDGDARLGRSTPSRRLLGTLRPLVRRSLCECLQARVG
jgi:hypothetical protein